MHSLRYKVENKPKRYDQFGPINRARITASFNLKVITVNPYELGLIWIFTFTLYENFIEIQYQNVVMVVAEMIIVIWILQLRR